MKKFSIVILSLLSLGIFSSSVMAAEEKPAISANFSLANDYIWRGLPQHIDITDGDKSRSEPTLSGGFDYDIGKGFALGVWGANVSFGGGTNTYNSASFEFDVYGSYSGEYKDFGYEVGYINYSYPNARNVNFEEAYLSLSMMGISLTSSRGIDQAPDNLEASYTIEDAGITITTGEYKQSNKYSSISFSETFDGIDYTVSMIKTDYVDEATIDESFIVFSMGKSF